MKIPYSLPFEKGFFGKRFFCSFENSLLGYSESLFRKESPKGQCQFLCFWKPMSKYYDFVDAWAANRWKTTGPSFDHPPWWSSYSRGAHCMPLSIIVWFVWSFDFSLSLRRKVGLPLEVWQESWPNFRWLPKVGEVATNHRVFLRCDWSPVSSWFYYQS